MKRTRIHVWRAVLVITAMVMAAHEAQATTYTWTQTGTGPYNWDDNANWGGAGFPNGAADVGRMTNTITVLQTNNLNQAITLNSLYVKGGAHIGTYGYLIASNNNSGSMNFSGTVPAITNVETFVTIAAPIVLNSDLTLAVDSGGNSPSVVPLAIKGVISGSGGLIKTSTGNLYLYAANTYQGNTTLQSVSANNSGFGITLMFSNSTLLTNVLPASTVLTIDATQAKPGQLSFNHLGSSGGTYYQTLAGLTGGGYVGMDGGGNATYYLTINNTNNYTYSGTMSQANGFGLIKTNTGTFTLTGANTYGLGTTVNGGTLLVNNTVGSGTGSGAVTVNTGGSLGGTGTVSGAVTVNKGGTLTPGNPVGMLTLSNNVTLASNATLNVTLNGTNATQYGRLFVASTNSTVGLTNCILNVALGYTPKNGDVFTIINHAGTNAIGGQFTCGTKYTVVATGDRFAVNYTGADGNDVVLTYMTVHGTAIYFR